MLISRFIAASYLILSTHCIVSAETVSYNWNIGWILAAPDGYTRPVIAINGQWPCPEVHVNVGDRLVVNVYNGLGNQSTGIHWHGINQRGTPEMDGSPGVAQCPIPPGSNMTYDFTVSPEIFSWDPRRFKIYPGITISCSIVLRCNSNVGIQVTQTGAYWYHSHSQGQYPDGLWGPLISHDPNPPFHYDEEIILTLSEWYHEQMSTLISAYQSPAGEAEDGSPNPPSGGALMNSKKNHQIHVLPGKTYLMHIICPGNYIGHGFYLNQHPITPIAIDGVYVDPVSLSGISNLSRIAPGQRMSVLFTTLNQTAQNYAIADFMSMEMLFTNKGLEIPSGYDANVTGYLVYNDSAPLPAPPVLHELGDDKFYDDLSYAPHDGQPLLEPVNRQIVIDIAAHNISNISRLT